MLKYIVVVGLVVWLHICSHALSVEASATLYVKRNKCVLQCCVIFFSP